MSRLFWIQPAAVWFSFEHGYFPREKYKIMDAPENGI